MHKKEGNSNKSNKEKRQPFLILDMDECLIHCKSEDEQTDLEYKHKSWDKVVSIEIAVTKQVIKGFVFWRPGVHRFQKEMSAFYEIAVFTASNKNYAVPIIKTLDPNNQYIKGKFFRDSCLKNSLGYWIKDLEIFVERRLDEIIIVDNSTSCFVKNLENGIPIIPYYGNREDDELKELGMFLEWLSYQKDFRTTQRNYFVFHKYFGQKCIDTAFKNVFADYPLNIY